LLLRPTAKATKAIEPRSAACSTRNTRLCRESRRTRLQQASRLPTLWCRPCAQKLLTAIVPITTLAVRIRPIPAEVRTRPCRHQSHCGDSDERADRDTGNDGTVVGARHPWAAVPIGSASPAHRPTPICRSAPSRTASPTGISVRARTPAPVRSSLSVRSPLDSLNEASLGAGKRWLGIYRSSRLCNWLDKEGNAQHCRRHRVLCHIVNPRARACSARFSRHYKNVETEF
jgi:hypothetical protein